MNVIGWILIVLLVLYLLYCLSFIFFQRKFIFRPRKLSHDYLFSCDQRLEEVNFNTEDGELINAVHIFPESKKGIVLYFHGNMQHLANYLPYVRKFTDEGWSVLLMDYRGYGKSSGALTEDNFFADTNLVYDYAKKFFPEEKIIIYGRSLGTAAATWLAAHQPSFHLILESPYSNLYDLARRYGMFFPNGNFLAFGFRTDQYIQKVKSPVTILHGTSDITVPIRSARKLKPFLKQSDRLIEINGAGHKNMEQFTEYHKAMEELLK